MRIGLGTLAAAALGAALAAAAPAADTVSVRAVAGQSYEGNIAGAGDTHAFLLEDFAPQLFSVSLKAGRGSALVPDLFLADPMDQDVTSTLDPVRRDTARTVVVRNSDALSSAGPWVLRVGGKFGSTGTYVLKITTRVLRTFKGTGVVPEPGLPAIGFFAPTGAKVSLKVVHSTGSVLVPVYGATTAPACVSAAVVPGLRPGTATLSVPFTGTYAVETLGNGGTEGGFNWLAKVKAFKPSRIPVRVNNGATYFPADGPAPSRLVTRPGQEVSGWDTDGIDLVWREVRTSGPPSQLGKQEIAATTVRGTNKRKLSGTYATDPMATARGFGLGPTAAVAMAESLIWVIPRAGGQESDIGPAPPAPRRVLVTRDAILVLQSGGIDSYTFMGASSPVSGDGSEYLDMAFGGLGLVFAVETAGGDLELRTAPLAGGGDTLLGNFGANPGYQGMAARGRDGFVAFSDGAGGSIVQRASSCDPGNPVLVAPLPNSVVVSLAADEINVYALENEAMDGFRIRQIPAGGGVPTVIVRNNEVTNFEILDEGIAAVGGYVYFMGEDGSDGFFRLKRR